MSTLLPSLVLLRGCLLLSVAGIPVEDPAPIEAIRAGDELTGSLDGGENQNVTVRFDPGKDGPVVVSLESFDFDAELVVLDADGDVVTF